MIDEADKIRSYFLGTLSESQAEELELRLISDAEFEANVLAAENELIEDRLDNTLTETQARNFDKNYLSSPERIRNLETVALLRRYAKIRVRNTANSKSEDESHVSFYDKIRELFSGIPAIAYAACLMLIIGVGLAYLWLGGNTADRSLQMEYASLNEQDLSDLNRFRSLPLITAVPGVVRGNGGNVKVLNSEKSVFVRLVLIDLQNETVLNASLFHSNSLLLKFDSLKTYEVNGSRELRLLLPANLLQKGAYQIKASPIDNPGKEVIYNFAIE
ncbi:MAG: hypothetical protein KA956_03055 [Pyrinomonadaceae bacterium]|nr:hypothetical protein [Acidobacteriota bacterium]MBP7375439.1 hypothetical protein [Pyrinomonadaceae bacterium]